MCESNPLSLFRYEDHHGKDHYLRTLKEAVRGAKTESLYTDRIIVLEQVETTLSRPLDETIKAVLCERVPLWMNIKIIAWYENGKRRFSKNEASRSSPDSQYNS